MLLVSEPPFPHLCNPVLNSISSSELGEWVECWEETQGWFCLIPLGGVAALLDSVLKKILDIGAVGIRLMKLNP